MDSFDTAKVIQVIVTNLKRRGDGIDDPLRPITQYFTFDGELLATVDPYPCPAPDAVSREMYENVIASNGLLQNALTELQERHDSLKVDFLRKEKAISESQQLFNNLRQDLQSRDVIISIMRVALNEIKALTYNNHEASTIANNALHKSGIEAVK